MAVGNLPILGDHDDGPTLAVRLTVFDQCGFSQGRTFHPLVQQSQARKELLEDIKFPNTPRARERWDRAAKHVAQRGFCSDKSCGRQDAAEAS